MERWSNKWTDRQADTLFTSVDSQSDRQSDRQSVNQSQWTHRTRIVIHENHVLFALICIMQLSHKLVIGCLQKRICACNFKTLPHLYERRRKNKWKKLSIITFWITARFLNQWKPLSNPIPSRALFDAEKCYEHWTYKHLNAKIEIIDFLLSSRLPPVTFSVLRDENTYWSTLVRRVDRQTNALPDRPTDRPTNRRTQPVIEVLCRT